MVILHYKGVAVEVSVRTSVRTMQSVKEIVSQRGKVMLLVDNYK